MIAPAPGVAPALGGGGCPGGGGPGGGAGLPGPGWPAVATVKPELEKASVPQIPDIVAAARQLAKSGTA